ncbi:MAG: membrane protein insertion efficiency factor YidD [Gammaproteobacteria bacterium]|nr:membrane protein insertion efficiency factor YidD [Gammaproteobacteria bacterium]
MKLSLLFLIKAYQYSLSFFIGRQCRFYPSCSSYAYEAIENHGSFKGLFLSLKRVTRCHPFCDGGYDPVPPRTTEGQT